MASAAVASTGRWRISGSRAIGCAVAALLLGVLAAALFRRYAPGLPPAVAAGIPDAVRALTAGLFLVAGLLRLGRWQLGEDSRSAQRAAALILLAVGLPMISMAGPLLQPASALTGVYPAAHLVVVLPALALLLAAGRTPVRPGALRPLPLAGLALLAWVSVTAALAALLSDPLACRLGEAVAAVGWSVLSLRVLRGARFGGASTRRWLAFGFLLMALSEAVRASSITRHPFGFGMALGLQVVAAAIAMCVAISDLRDAFRSERGHTDDVARALYESRAELLRLEQFQQDRIHDARTAVASVLGASTLLADPNRGAIADPARLQRMMTAELHRLQQTLADDATEPIQEFALADALGDVVLGHRLAGGRIDADLGTCRVLGRPRATATAVANLLDNARTHAPGAMVMVRAEQRASTVVITVTDDGPGMPGDLTDRLLTRGIRGSQSTPGTGVGLYTAAVALSEQSGSLRVNARTGEGASVELTLPTARRTPTESGAPR